MLEDARFRGGFVLGTFFVAVGLVLELLSFHAPGVGFGVISGGWILIVVTLVRALRGDRTRV